MDSSFDTYLYLAIVVRVIFIIIQIDIIFIVSIVIIRITIIAVRRGCGSGLKGATAVADNGLAHSTDPIILSIVCAKNFLQRLHCFCCLGGLYKRQTMDTFIHCNKFTLQDKANSTKHPFILYLSLSTYLLSISMRV
jgi:hypothetical protein